MDEKGKHTQGVREEDESREHERLGEDMTWESSELTGICVLGICSTVYKMHSSKSPAFGSFFPTVGQR